MQCCDIICTFGLAHILYLLISPFQCGKHGCVDDDNLYSHKRLHRSAHQLGSYITSRFRRMYIIASLFLHCVWAIMILCLVYALCAPVAISDFVYKLICYSSTLATRVHDAFNRLLNALHRIARWFGYVLLCVLNSPFLFLVVSFASKSISVLSWHCFCYTFDILVFYARGHTIYRYWTPS